LAHTNKCQINIFTVHINMQRYKAIAMVDLDLLGYSGSN